MLRERLLQRTPRATRRHLRRLVYLPEDIWTQLRSIVLGQQGVELLPPRGLRDVGAGDFLEVGRRHAGYFRDLAGLDATSRVLDIGCGIGRMAMPLTGYLVPPGGYEGFDVRCSDVAWCQRHITRRHPHFRFTHLDIYNAEYNWDGKLDAETARFPYGDDAFDLVVAASVFTHLLLATTLHYLSEIERVLAPGGGLFATFFLLDAEIDEMARRGLECLPFRPYDGPVSVHDPDNPEGAVAYRKEFLQGALEKAGLELEPPVRHGWWSGRQGELDYQDVVIARKPSSEA